MDILILMVLCMAVGALGIIAILTLGFELLCDRIEQQTGKTLEELLKEWESAE